MRTGAEYLESLRDGRRVYVGGELIEDVTTHPMTKGYANAIAEYYDLHLDPKNQDIATFVDDERQASVDALVPAAIEGRRGAAAASTATSSAATSRAASSPVRRPA